MPDYSVERRDYALYRLKRSEEDLDAAKILFGAESYRVANNRAYYAIFHALRAVLVLDGFDSSKHSGVISEFRRRYIKGGIFPVGMSKMIGSAFTIRSASDYDDMFVADKEEAAEQIKNAEYIYGLVNEYIGHKLKGE